MCCEGMSLQKTIFEVVSAFSTTGFSVGASAEMNVPAKLIMVFTMLAGRIGPVTLMTSLIIRKITTRTRTGFSPREIYW